MPVLALNAEIFAVSPAARQIQLRGADESPAEINTGRQTMKPKLKVLRESARSRRVHSQSFNMGLERTLRWRRPAISSDVHRQFATPPESREQRGSRIRPRKSLKIVLISDLHELFREVEIPNGDILLCAGDWTMFSRSLRFIVDFNEWLGDLPHQHKVCVPGNHETYLQSDPANRSLISNATLLINEGLEIEGLRIWGSPVTPVGPAFSMKSAEQRRLLYDTIPSETDILITHGPPRGILDRIPGSSFHAGDQELLDAVNRVRPRLHVFGHVHGAYGMFATKQTLFANAALLGLNGDIEKKPFVLRMEQR